MQSTIIFIFVLFSFLLLISSFVYSLLSEKNNYLLMVAGLMIVVLGACLLSGIEYSTGEISVEDYDLNEISSVNATYTNGTITTTNTKNYTTYNNSLSVAVSIIIMLFGCVLIILTPLSFTEKETIDL